MEHKIDFRMSLFEEIPLIGKRLRLILEMRQLGYRFDWLSGYFRFKRSLFNDDSLPDIWIEEFFSLIVFQLRSGKKSGNHLIQQWHHRSDVSTLVEDTVRFEGSDALEYLLNRLDCPPSFARVMTPLMRDRIVRLESHDVFSEDNSDRYHIPYYVEENDQLMATITSQYTVIRIK